MEISVWTRWDEIEVGSRTFQAEDQVQRTLHTKWGEHRRKFQLWYPKLEAGGNEYDVIRETSRG